MSKKIILPTLLFLNGIINLFPKTSAKMVSWGFEPVTVQTVIGLLSVILAIAVFSGLYPERKKEL